MSKPTVLVNFLQALLAIILGNVVYFILLPSMPPAARHRPFRLGLRHAGGFLLLCRGVRLDPHREKVAIAGSYRGSGRPQLLSEPW